MRNVVSFALVLIVSIVFVGSAHATPPLDPMQQEIADRIVSEVLLGKTDGVRVVVTPVPLSGDHEFEFLWSGGELVPPRGAE